MLIAHICILVWLHTPCIIGTHPKHILLIRRCSVFCFFQQQQHGSFLAQGSRVPRRTSSPLNYRILTAFIEI